MQEFFRRVLFLHQSFCLIHMRNCLFREELIEKKILSKMSAIKQQRVTSVFYLPKGGGLKSEYIAVLDDLHNVPAPYFYNKLMLRNECNYSILEA
jgi:hypothetical protein